MRTRKSGQVADARKQTHAARCNENTMRKRLKEMTKERDTLAKECNALQSKVDALMQEYCPEEKHQKPLEIPTLDEMRKLLKVPNAIAQGREHSERPSGAEG